MFSCFRQVFIMFSSSFHHVLTMFSTFFPHVCFIFFTFFVSCSSFHARLGELTQAVASLDVRDAKAHQRADEARVSVATAGFHIPWQTCHVIVLVMFFPR